MPELTLGPLLRYVDETQATIWVETDGPCEVTVLDATERTFQVGGRHYALVHVTGLRPGTDTPYAVHLDGERKWPIGTWAFPPSRIRTIDPERTLRVAFGSCRVAMPHVPPYTLAKDDDPLGREVDALMALALELRREPAERWPDVLLMIGDQVYADEDAPRTREFIRSRRDTSLPPHDDVLDYEEYAHLYHESWSEPAIRWLFSTVSSAMLFDDHDVNDDWNTSLAWLEEMRAKPWWDQRITSALASYFVYQQLGNLPPGEMKQSELLERLKREEDGLEPLLAWAREADRDVDGSRWSYCRTLGRTRIVMLDSREGRDLTPGSRRIVDDKEWAWIEEHATGGFDHLILADTLPVFFSPAFHHAEAFSEALCDGRWGSAPARVGERLRRAFDLEHWAAFHHSFRRMCDLVAAVSRGERGEPPKTITLLGGDVHHAYTARIEVPGGRSRTWQAVCSPMRNPLSAKERRQAKQGNNRLLAALARRLARAIGVPEPPLRWRIDGGPLFDNQIGMLVLDGDRATVRIRRTTDGGWRHPSLTTSLERTLS